MSRVAPDGNDVEMRRAAPADVADVAGVLDEAAAWLQRRGVVQWPARFEPSWLGDALVRGETWLAFADGLAVGTFTLDWADPLWADAEGSAGYVHRMAVRRRAAGLGAVMLDRAADAVRRNGRRFLRLDCVAANARLRSYYEANGFAYRGDAEVGGAPGQRDDDGDRTRVSRYERCLVAATAPGTRPELG